MPKSTVNWDSAETWERIVASIIASGVKLDLGSIAKYYGTTYHTLENRFRKTRKDAKVLEAEVNSGERGDEGTPTRTKSVPATPRKAKTPKKDPLETVANGRVTKKSPTKKSSVKQEQHAGDASCGLEEAADDKPGPSDQGTAATFGGDDDLFQ